MQYIPDIKYEILFDRIKNISFKSRNVKRLNSMNFNKN